MLPAEYEIGRTSMSVYLASAWTFGELSDFRVSDCLEKSLER